MEVTSSINWAPPWQGQQRLLMGSDGEVKPMPRWILMQPTLLGARAEVGKRGLLPASCSRPGSGRALHWQGCAGWSRGLGLSSTGSVRQRGDKQSHAAAAAAGLEENPNACCRIPTPLQHRPALHPGGL